MAEADPTPKFVTPESLRCLADDYRSHMKREHGVEADTLNVVYTAAGAIVRKFFGRDWLDENVVNGSPPSYFKPDSDGWRHQDRLITLGDILFNLQHVEGALERFRALIPNRDIEGAIAELRGAALLRRRAIVYSFVQECGTKGTDFDALIDCGSSSLPCEFKCKLSSTLLTKGTIITTVKSARSQVPEGSPFMVMMQVPEAWTADAEFDRVRREATNELFRNSKRLHSVVFHSEIWFTHGESRTRSHALWHERNPACAFHAGEIESLRSRPSQPQVWTHFATIVCPNVSAATIGLTHTMRL
jgi:hypothetical protein